MFDGAPQVVLYDMILKTLTNNLNANVNIDVLGCWTQTKRSHK